MIFNGFFDDYLATAINIGMEHKIVIDFDCMETGALKLEHIVGCNGKSGHDPTLHFQSLRNEEEQRSKVSMKYIFFI
jgi:hypothetical protein